ncbi:MAG: hypothetical protein ACC645_16030, partial [Pirellulales bacterium]
AETEPLPNRRALLQSAGAAVSALAAARVGIGPSLEIRHAGAADPPAASPGKTYETHARGIRILPGQWRPHYRFEQIAWVSPPWPSQDYLWLDFPEAIFTNQGLLYLSHVNPPIKTLFHDLPRVPWRKISGGVAFERQLPNGVSFGGSVKKGGDTTVDLELHIHNGTAKELANITLQTCVYLRASKEFADFTRDNKFVHVPDSGWIRLPEADALKEGTAKVRVGWRTHGKAVADLPVLVTLSNQADRLVAMTWFEDTLSLVSNPGHPCMHADPRFPDLAPGGNASVRGKLIFFEGKLRDFDFAKYAR